MRSFPLLLLVVISGCECWYTADRDDIVIADAAAPPVQSLAVVPHAIYVKPGAQFVVYARIYDHLKGTLPGHAQLTWTTGPGLKERGHTGDSARIEAAPSATPLTSSVTAKIGALSATATVSILVSNVPGTDSILGTNTLWSTPHVVLLYDTLAAPSVQDSLIAYTTVGLAGNLHGGPGELARFSAAESFRLQPATWHNGTDVVHLESGNNQLRRPAFRIWIASTDVRAESLARVDVQYAASVFMRQRSGLALQPTISLATGAGTFFHELGPPPALRCLGLAGKLQALGIPIASSSFAKESLNVVYVDDLVDLPTDPEVPVSAGFPGYSCPAEVVIGSVIVVSMRLRAPGTLTHELGHSAGLVEPEWGHTNYLSGFSYTNMMWRYEWDATTAPRSTFSLGQAFRINVDDHSWIRWLSGASRNCDSLAVGRTCPRLEKDLVPLP